MAAAPKPGFLAQLKSFPAQFWVANTMEIFERLSWYGWFTVMALYVTAPPENGGLGFSTEVRGNLQGIVPFFLYLFPVVTGALADRFGFKKMFIIAYIVMIISYYSLGQFTSLPGFFLAFMFVAVGAAIFKPVVVGTVARVTDDSNSATGFGIFYMMVNIGGFVGPIVAGVVRGWDWNYVFIACSFWAFINLLLVLIFYREPPAPEGVQQKKEGSIIEALAGVFRNAGEVLGNARFVITCFVVLVALMIAGLGHEWFTWVHCGVFVGAWLLANVVYDTLLPKQASRRGEGDRPWMLQRMRCSNWRFALFLLIMSGFWTAFNQIFITMPEYIRDFTETRPMIRTFQSVFGEGAADEVATINDDERETILRTVHAMTDAYAEGNLDNEIVTHHVRRLDTLGVSLAPTQIDDLLQQAIESERSFKELALDAGDAVEPQELPQWGGLVAAVEELIQAKRTQDFDEDGAKVLMSEGALELWDHGVRVTGTKLTGLLPTDEEIKALSDGAQAAAAAEAAAEAVQAYRTQILEDLAHLHERGWLGWTVLKYGSHELLASKVRVNPDELKALVAENPDDFGAVADAAIEQGRQFNPEFIININAGSIVLFQVFISFLMARFHRFTTMIVGMVIAGVGIGLSAFADAQGFFGMGGSIWIVALGLLTFSFGEMMASPTSQEYVGRIAPGDKKALYMGYYFVAIALGNLFGGILSGQLYGTLARDMQRPDLMWLCFGGLMFVTAIIFVVYNKFALPKTASDSLTSGSNG